MKHKIEVSQEAVERSLLILEDWRDMRDDSEDYKDIDEMIDALDGALHE